MRATVAVPASPLRRAAAAGGSILLLAGLIAGLPVALALFAGNPLPSDLPTVDGIRTALTSPDDGSLFLTVLAIIGWLAWASFTGSVVLEVVSRVTRRAPPSIPGLRGQQRFAAILIAAVAALMASPTLTSAAAALVDSPPVAAAATASANSAEQPVSRGFGAAGAAGAAEQSVQRGLGSAKTVLHLVERGEGILDLQDRYGVPWQRIAEHNYGVTQPDGRTLERGQTRIYPGWQMHIPTAASNAALASSTPATDAAPAADTAPASTPQVGFGARGDDAEPATPPETYANLAAAEEQAPPEYEVAQGDWMWHIADRYLGDPERYGDIAELNPQYADQRGDFPDHIEPGWTLQLPADAVDSGPTRHATGAATSAVPDSDGSTTPDQPATEDEAEPLDQPEDDHVAEAVPTLPGEPSPSPGTAGAAPPLPPEQHAPPPPPPPPQQPPQPVPAEPANDPAVVVGFGTAPAAPPAEPADGFSTGAEQHERNLDRLAPAALASAGLLTALVLGAAAYHVRRRHQHHRAGFRFASPPAQRLEKTLRAAAQPLDTARLDAALRALAAGLASRSDALPDIAGALVDEGAVHLLLAEPCPDPPEPWDDDGDRWTVPAGTAIPAVDGATPLAPLPMLVAVGSQAGTHLLLDLERLGFLAIHGEPEGAIGLLRYVAAELACNTWSDAAEILLAGFDPAETELLATLGAERFRAVPSIPEAVAMLRQRAGSARATLSRTGAPDAFSGRVRGVAGDAWMPQVLIAAAPTSADLSALAELEHELEGTRCAVAVATTDTTPPKHDAWRVTVTPDGVVHVRLPFLRASLSAAALTVEELAPLAETMRAARGAPQLPVPAAAEAEPWATATDAAGALRTSDLRVDAEGATAPTPLPPAESDLHLDDDLRAWYGGTTGQPRIGILGPVIVDASGPPPELRRRLHAELVVYLAQRGARGADAALLDSALWPDVTVAGHTRELVVSRARRWLGADPGGAPWLPDVGADLGYRLADGYLFDWHLFRRLRARGESRGPDGAEDLHAALRLVRGVPLDGAQHPRAPGTRNPYPWLAESDMHPDHLVASIVDTAHQLAELCLAAGDPSGARWAVQQAWLADPARGYDQPWRDLLRAEHADGQTSQLRALLAELMEVRDAEAPEDLAPETYGLISCWPPNVLVPTTGSPH